MASWGHGHRRQCAAVPVSRSLSSVGERILTRCARRFPRTLAARHKVYGVAGRTAGVQPSMFVADAQQTPATGTLGVDGHTTVLRRATRCHPAADVTVYRARGDKSSACRNRKQRSLRPRSVFPPLALNPPKCTEHAAGLQRAGATKGQTMQAASGVPQLGCPEQLSTARNWTNWTRSSGLVKMIHSCGF